MKKKIGFDGSRKGMMCLNFLAFIPRIIFLAIMLICCVVLIRLFVVSHLDVNDIKAEVLISGFLYSKGGVGQYDPLTSRHFPEIINISQLREDKLMSAFYYPDNRLMAAKITLRSYDDAEIKTIYYNYKWYDRWEPLVLSMIPGRGGVDRYKKRVPILYVRDNEPGVKLGIAEFEVLQPKM